jgi:hypothetical protein
MAKTDREKRICIMRREGNRLAPVTQFDAEMLAEFANGKDIEVTFKQRRSNDQLRAYWKWLAEVVSATECAPSAEHLHETLKLEMGYVTRIRRFDGTTQIWPDSTALSKMEGPEFTGFFRRAERLIAETFGFSKEDMAA